MKKIILPIVFITFFYGSDAQIKLSIEPQIGWADFNHTLRYGMLSPYHDYVDIIYLGINTSLEKEIYKNINISSSVGFTKNGMEGRAFMGEILVNGTPRRREIWSVFNIYNVRLSTNISYNLDNIVEVGIGLQYIREIIAYEKQQEVWISDYNNGNQFFEKQPAFRYDEFRKNNFYGSVYLKHFVVPKIAVSIGVNMGLDSIIPVELQYYTRPFEYYLGVSFYPFIKDNGK